MRHYIFVYIEQQKLKGFARDSPGMGGEVLLFILNILLCFLNFLP